MHESLPFPPSGFGAFASATVDRNARCEGQVLGLRGNWKIECYSPSDVLKWVEFVKNMVCNAALDDVLNVYLRAGTPAAAWYLGLIDNAGFTSLANADTAASHGLWTENTSYTQSTRPVWGPAASSGQQVTNATQVTFTMNAAVTIRGAFAISDSTKGGTAGLLFSTAAFSGGNQPAGIGDNIKVTYSAPAVAV